MSGKLGNQTQHKGR